MAVVSLLPHALVRVSSVLNRDAKQYGKRCMFDGNSDTCWNSDQGTPQWIHFDFSKQVNPKIIHIQFQGGFAGKDCTIEGQSDDQVDLLKLANFYPEDVNAIQAFPIDIDCSLRSLRIMFNNSTDFFGRVIIYQLDIFGEVG